MRDALAINNNVKPKASTPRRQRRRRVNKGNGMTATEIPLEIAYTVRQTANPKTHVERASEYIGSFTISQTTPVGSLVTFMMNPATLAGTRIKSLANSYQKFRFRRMALKLQSSTTTAINGLYILGYNSNPDAEVNVADPVPAVYALPGAISTNVWRSAVCNAQLEDRNKWYNIDADSTELMNTTQGCFYVCVQSPTNSATPVSMPVLLDYEIEFRGNAVNYNNTNAPFVWPAGQFTYNATNATFGFVASSGEPVLPALAANAGYVINPSWEVTSGEDQAFVAVVKNSSAENTYRFYESVEQYQTDSYLHVVGAFTVGRSTGQRIGPN